MQYTILNDSVVLKCFVCQNDSFIEPMEDEQFQADYVMTILSCDKCGNTLMFINEKEKE